MCGENLMDIVKGEYITVTVGMYSKYRKKLLYIKGKWKKVYIHL